LTRLGVYILINTILLIGYQSLLFGVNKSFLTNLSALDSAGRDSVFSPNNDKIEDELIIKFTSTKETSYKVIIDTDHNSVFDSEDKTFSGEALPGDTVNIIWDGADKEGNLCPSGVYPIQIKLIHPDQTLTNTSLAGIIEGPSWYAGDLHIHCLEYSWDGKSTIEEMVKKARAIGFDFLAFTDHSNKFFKNLNSPTEWREAKEKYLNFANFLAILPGHEISSAEVGSGQEGPHLNVIGKDIGFYQGNTNIAITEIIEGVTKENGIVILNHPFCTIEDGGTIPWENLYISSSKHITCIEDRYYTKFDPDFNHDPETIKYVYSQWDKGIPIWIIGSSDAHSKNEKFGTEFSMVFAKAPTYKAIMDAIRSGHLYIVYNSQKSKYGKDHIGTEGIPTLDFKISDTKKQVMIGDFLKTSLSSVTIFLWVRASEGNKVKKIQIKTNSGKILFEEEPNTFEFKKSYMVELESDLCWFTVDVLTTDWDRILSNPIFVVKEKVKSQKEDLDNEIQVYPTPLISKKYGFIYFTGVKKNSTIRIYNLAGELIKKIFAEDTVTTWNLKNTYEKNVASGIYIYIITNDQKIISKGRFIIY
jgi:hypothetical protein